MTDELGSILTYSSGTAAHECVSEDALIHLKSYKYSSVDKSLISHYILRHYVQCSLLILTGYWLNSVPVEWLCQTPTPMARPKYGHPSWILLHHWERNMLGDIHTRHGWASMLYSTPIRFASKGRVDLCAEMLIGTKLAILQLRLWIMDVSTLEGTYDP